MKRSNIVNQHSFLGSVLVAGLALAASLALVGCAADADSSDANSQEDAPAVVDQGSDVALPIPIPAAPAKVVGAQSASPSQSAGGITVPIPAARSTTSQSATSDAELGDITVPIPALKP